MSLHILLFHDTTFMILLHTDYSQGNAQQRETLFLPKDKDT